MFLINDYFSPSDLILHGMLLVVMMAIMWSFWTLHRKNGSLSNFNLMYLVTSKEGFPDGAKCVELGVFVLMSWGFVVYMTKGNLPEWFLIAYVSAFVTRGAFGAYLRSKGEPPEAPGTTVKTEAVTTVKTTEVTPQPDQPKEKL